jgi:hypothetical protein
MEDLLSFALRLPGFPRPPRNISVLGRPRWPSIEGQIAVRPSRPRADATRIH